MLLWTKRAPAHSVSTSCSLTPKVGHALTSNTGTVSGDGYEVFCEHCFEIEYSFSRRKSRTILIFPRG
jgi:hypothetical protein